MHRKENAPAGGFRIRNAGIKEIVQEVDESVRVLERLATNDLLPSEPHREEMRRFRDGLSRLAATTKGGRLTNEFKLRYREEAQD